MIERRRAAGNAVGGAMGGDPAPIISRDGRGAVVCATVEAGSIVVDAADREGDREGEIHHFAHAPMHRNHWLILGVGCGAVALYFNFWARQDIAFVSSGERLPRLGLMIGFAFAGGGGNGVTAI